MKKLLGVLVLVIVINCTSQFSKTEEIGGAVTEAKTIDNNGTLTVTTSGTVYLNTNDLISLSGTTSPTLDNSGEIINGSGADGLTDGNNKKTVNFDSCTNCTITNSGTIRSHQDNAIRANNASGLTITNSGSIEADAKQTIKGSGGVSNIVITNSGTIKAEGGSSTIFFQEMNTGTFTNTGTISASNEKTFNIAGGDNITITN